MARMDLTGRRFGKLTVTAYDCADKHWNLLWMVRCDCGKTYSAHAINLRSGRATQCRECARVKHGQTTGGHPSPLYTCWVNMRKRCYNPKHSDYSNYGGRGIKIAPEWRVDFAEFSSYVESVLGPRPEGCSLDRIDNDGNYAPGNLRWATCSQQGRNRRSNVKISFNGKQIILEEFARLIRRDASGVSRQLRNGLTAEYIADCAGYYAAIPLAA